MATLTVRSGLSIVTNTGFVADGAATILDCLSDEDDGTYARNSTVNDCQLKLSVPIDLPSNSRVTSMTATFRVDGAPPVEGFGSASTGRLDFEWLSSTGLVLYSAARTSWPGGPVEFSASATDSIYDPHDSDLSVSEIDGSTFDFVWSYLVTGTMGVRIHDAVVDLTYVRKGGGMVL